MGSTIAGPVLPADRAAQPALPAKQLAAAAAAICAAPPAASDSSGTEASGSTRHTLRQASFASTDTRQQLMPPPPPDGKPQQPQQPPRSETAATAAAIMLEPPPPPVSVVASCVMQPAGSGSDGGLRIATAAIKLEPVPYDGSSGVSGGSSGHVPGPAGMAVKREPGPQPVVGQQAAARALCNRQSAARSKERRRAYVVGLEQSVRSLTSQVNEQLAHLHSLACNDTALRAANQALHSHMTQLSEQLAAADWDMSSLRSECQQLRQTVTPTSSEQAQAISGPAQRMSGDSMFHRTGSADTRDNMAAQQAVSRQRCDSPELLYSAPSQQPGNQQSGQQLQQATDGTAEPESAAWECLMDWSDDQNAASRGGSDLEGKTAGGDARLDRAPEQQLMPSPPPQDPPPQQQQQQQQQQPQHKQRQQQQQQQHPQKQQPQAEPTSNAQPAQQQHQSASQQRAPQQQTNVVPGPAPAPAISQQSPDGAAAPPPVTAPVFRGPSVSTGADAWRPSRVPSIRSGSALAGAWPQAPPVQSGTARGALPTLRAGRSATDGSVTSAAAIAVRSNSALEGTSTSPTAAAAGAAAVAVPPEDGSGGASTMRAVAAAAIVHLRPKHAAGETAGGGSGDGGGSTGSGKRRKKLHTSLQASSFPPAQPAGESDKLMSLAEIDALVAKYTAAAAPALGPGHGAPGQPGQVSGLRLCSAPSGLQINICKPAGSQQPVQSGGGPGMSAGMAAASSGRSIMDEAASGKQGPLAPMSSGALDEMAAIFDNILEGGSGTFPDLEFLPEAPE